jgi:hypothetical protein
LGTSDLRVTNQADRSVCAAMRLRVSEGANVEIGDCLADRLQVDEFQSGVS